MRRKERQSRAEAFDDSLRATQYNLPLFMRSKITWGSGRDEEFLQQSELVLLIEVDCPNGHQHLKWKFISMDRSRLINLETDGWPSQKVIQNWFELVQ